MSEWKFSPTEYEEELDRLSKSNTPATMGALAQLGSVFLKALTEKFKLRDAHLALIESRVAKHTGELEKRLAALERKASL